MADPFKPTPKSSSLIDWLGACRPTTIIVLVMIGAALLALVPAAFR